MLDLTTYIVSLSFSGMILSIVYFALRPFIKKYFSTKINYFICLVVLLRFMLPFSFDLNLTNIFFNNSRNISVIYENLDSADYKISELWNTPLENNGTTETQKETPAINIEDSEPADEKSDIPNAKLSLNPYYLILIIPAVSIVLLLVYIINYHRFLKELKNTFLTPNDNYVRLFNIVRKNLNIKRNIPLFQSKFIQSPVILGFFKPIIVIPLKEFDEERLENIYLHELIHYKHKDILLKWIIAFVSCVHFFNPFIYLLRKDFFRLIELYCDEDVIKSMNGQGLYFYGETLIDSACDNNFNVSFVNMLSEEKKFLKERIVYIMNFKIKSKKIAFFSIATLLSIIFIGLFFGQSVIVQGFVDDFSRQVDLTTEEKLNSDWNKFPEKLKNEGFLPKEAADFCNTLANSAYMDKYHWENESVDRGYVGILLDLRDDEILRYFYRNGGRHFADPINKIDEDKAVSMVVNFLKYFNITDEPAKIMSQNIPNQEKYSKMNLTINRANTKNPNYILNKVSIKMDEKHDYEFTVDMNMGAIIAYDNIYFIALSENDTQLSYSVVLNGKTDYENKIKENEIFSWQDSKGKFLRNGYNGMSDKVIEFDNYDSMIEKLKLSKTEIILPKDIPNDYILSYAQVGYYLTKDTVNLKKPTHKTEVSKNVYFVTYTLDEKFYEQVCYVTMQYVHKDNPEETFFYRIDLVNSRENFYQYAVPDFVIKDSIIEPLNLRSLFQNSASEVKVSYLDDYTPPEELKEKISNPMFEDSAYEETIYDGYSSYYVTAIKHLDKEIMHYIPAWEINDSRQEVYSAIEIGICIISEDNSKDSLMDVFNNLYILN